MMAKMGASLGSPTLGATVAQLRNRIPTQWRRYVPVYIAVVLVILFFNMVPFESDEHISAIRHTTKGSSHTKLPRPPIRAEFPKKIWQTWKVNQFSFEPRDLDRARSWTDKNPDWRYEVLTDANEEQYVEYHFGPDNLNRPDIVKFYKDVRAAIVKADLLRYIIMYVEGGVYADIDVEAMKPMSKFIPERYNHRDIDMVIGVEIDEPDWKDHPILGPKSRSFCQWTFVCKPQLPVMMRLIEQIMTWLEGVAKKQGVSISDVKLDFDEIISGTGPSAFTTAILTEMNENSAHPVTWDDFHDLGESKVVSRFLVMTVEAFAAGQGHSDSGNHGARAALVKHHYHASNWPSRHPRYSHPAYGEVENCNWNDECVRRWDEDVAAFGKMTKQEQDKIVEEKNREKQEKKEEEERKQREEEDQRRREQEEREKQDREREERERAEREQAEKDKKAAEEDKKKKDGKSKKQ